MSQLLQAEPDEIADLEVRARQVCLVFEERLPPGFEPGAARVGFEVDPRTGNALLHIDRAVEYRGENPEVADWVRLGTARFHDVEAMIEWLQGPLAAAYVGVDGGSAQTGSTPPSSSTNLLDPSAIAAELRVNVIGQDAVIDELADAVALQLARVAPRRPLAMMALGPTGVGKTLVAESLGPVLARLTGLERTFLRLDMNEFQEPHTVSRLFGAPPGYIGYAETPALVEVLSRDPGAVVLVDEVDKAHHDVFTALMNLLDTGRLTPAGRAQPVDARRAIVIMTSNLGVERLLPAAAGVEDPVEVDHLVRAHLRRKGVRPELVGRLHRTLLFRPLGEEHRRRITHQAIERAAETFGIHVLDVEPAALDLVNAVPLDEVSGVRALEYAVDRLVGPAFVAARRGGFTDVRLCANPLRCEAALATPPAEEDR